MGSGDLSLKSDDKEAKAALRAQEKERDRKLVALAKEGKREAFRELFQHYNRRAFSIAIGVVKNEQDALDIVQDAFVKVHKHIANFQGSSSFYTWLYRIVMNLSIDHIRKRKRARNIDVTERVGAAAAGESSHALAPRLANASPSKNVERSELIVQLQAAMAELPEHHRAVITLREVEGLSYEEMAEILEVPKGTIMSRLFHARRKLQQSLAPYIDGDIAIRE